MCTIHQKDLSIWLGSHQHTLLQLVLRSKIPPAFNSLCLEMPRNWINLKKIVIVGLFWMNNFNPIYSGTHWYLIISGTLFSSLEIFPIQIFIPETPVYLIGKNKIEPAHKILRILRGKRWDVTEELTNIKIASESEVKHKVPYKNIFPK